MEDNRLKFKGTIFASGGSICMILPKELRDYIGVETDDDGKPTTELMMTADTSKHGRFIGVWNPKQQAK